MVNYDFKYGFFQTGLTENGGFDYNYFTEVNEEILKAYTWKQNPNRTAWNKNILNRHNANFDLMINRIKSGWDPKYAVSAFHTENIGDYDLYCINYIRTKENKAMFPAPWQHKATTVLEGKLRRATVLSSRKIGKSTWTYSRCGYITAKYGPRNVVLLYPTEDQGFIMEDIYNTHLKSTFLMDDMVMPKNPDTKHRGKFTTDMITYGRNGSSMEGYNLNVQKGGDTKKGIRGSDILIDEWPNIPKLILSKVIAPAILDAYSEKWITKVGTPTLKWNPELADDFNLDKEDPSVAVMMIDWMDGLLEGTLQPSTVVELFKKEYKIDCPFGCNYGVCLPRLLETKDAPLIEYYMGDDYKLYNLSELQDAWAVRYDKNNGKIISPDNPDYDYTWFCAKQCMQNNDFAEELGIEFGKAVNDFFSEEILDYCFRTGFRFQHAALPNETYIIGMDVGQFVYPAQILVFKRIQNGLQCVYWREVPPVKTANPDRPPDYWPTANAFFEVYELFNMYGHVQRCYVDISNNIEISAHLVNGNAQHRGIPRPVFYRNQTAEKNGTFGIWNHAPDNTATKIHYQKCLINGRMLFPSEEKEFAKRFKWEHLNCEVRKLKGGLLGFEPTNKKRGKIDIMDTASACSLDIDNDANYVPATKMAFTDSLGIHLL